MTQPFLPQVDDLFMVSFKNGDRSYVDNVFRVLDRDDRVTIAGCVAGYSHRERPYVFINAYMNFHQTTPARAALLGMKTED